MPTVDSIELYARQSHAAWAARTDLAMGIFDRDGRTFLGGSGLHRIDWRIPKFSIGYWLRTDRVGQGLVAEATRAITLFAFDHLQARRIELTCDIHNTRSQRVAERCGYTLEGIARDDDLHPDDGSIRCTRIYAVIRADRERVASSAG